MESQSAPYSQWLPLIPPLHSSQRIPGSLGDQAAKRMCPANAEDVGLRPKEKAEWSQGLVIRDPTTSHNRLRHPTRQSACEASSEGCIISCSSAWWFSSSLPAASLALSYWPSYLSCCKSSLWPRLQPTPQTLSSFCFPTSFKRCFCYCHSLLIKVTWRNWSFSLRSQWECFSCFSFQPFQ